MADDNPIVHVCPECGATRYADGSLAINFRHWAFYDCKTCHQAMLEAARKLGEEAAINLETAIFRNLEI